MNILRLFHTVRFLRFSQIMWRFVRKLHLSRPDVLRAPEMRSVLGQWAMPACQISSMTASNKACFLNVERDISGSTIWNDPDIEKLWLYNLHYFDDLNAEDASERRTWHEALINRWINENPLASGNGWEPYPTSLRMVNWIKWLLAQSAGLQPPTSGRSRLLHSLAIQSRYLCHNLEYHLLGNHLFTNAKALVFAGAFFKGPEADGWMHRGLKILHREIPEQIMPDGGQFERSPMYHSIALEDMCDLINICHSFPDSVPDEYRTFVESWPGIVSSMVRWLQVMCHPDGQIVLFNDAAFGIAPHPAELLGYWDRIAQKPLRPEKMQCENLKVDKGGCNDVQTPYVTQLTPSGYIRVDDRDMAAFLDVAPIGPDYLPGHAHADTLNFELSLFGQRIIVDSGTSCYGLGSERLRQRSTRAHNTVVVNGENSSEVWSGFRVARRAYPQNFSILQDDNSISVSCEHNGYTRLPGKPIHARRWHFGSGSIQIYDKIKGEHTTSEARFHLHPDVLCKQIDTRTIELILPKGQRCTLIFSAHPIELEKSSYHPEFGITLPCVCISVAFIDELTTSLAWT